MRSASLADNGFILGFYRVIPLFDPDCYLALYTWDEYDLDCLGANDFRIYGDAYYVCPYLVDI